MLKLATLALLLALPGVSAADTVWVTGGSASGDTRVGYSTLVLPLGEGRLSDGWTQSFGVDAVTYGFDDAGMRMKGMSRSLRYGLMRQIPVAGGTVGLGVGASLRNTTLRPAAVDLGNDRTRVRATVDPQWQSAFDRAWRSQAFSQYTLASRNHFFASFVGRRVHASTYLGPELSGSGDPNYRLWGAAMALTGLKAGSFDVGLQLGAQHLEGGRTRPAVGFSLVRYTP